MYELPHELPNDVNQEIRKGKENLEIGWRHREHWILPPKTNFLAIALKTYKKADIKVF